MRVHHTAVAGVILIGLCGGVRVAGAASGDAATTDRADEAFAAGDFTIAEEGYRARLSRAPTDRRALLRIGEISLYANRLVEAERYLSSLLEFEPDDAQATALLAERFYRGDDFPRAARYFRATGKTAMAKKLEHFGDLSPYETVADVTEAHIKFILTDPLPLVQVQVNGSKPVNFIIDTGGGEVVLDPELADAVGATRFGEGTGSFAGDKKASTVHARIDSLRLGEFDIRNVPVTILSTRRFAAAAGGKRVDGVLGTILLYHFLSTIDYPRGELVLRRRPESKRHATRDAAGASQAVAIPFWMAGDHLMLARGRVNQAEPCLMLVDTGLAGNGFACPLSTIEAAGIELSGPEYEGVGGGGTVRVRPFVTDELSLGAVTRKNVMSIAGAFPESLEHRFGFRIGGLVSHSFFRSFALTFDFDEMKLRLLKQK